MWNKGARKGSRHTIAEGVEKGARKGPHPALHHPRPYNDCDRYPICSHCKDGGGAEVEWDPLRASSGPSP